MPAPTSVCGGWTSKLIFDAIREHGVTHMCGAPIVYNMLINAPAELASRHRPHRSAATSPAPLRPLPPSRARSVSASSITHVYGLTETYGPASVCAKQDEWQSLPLAERARLNARQGVAGPMQEAMTVLDPDTMEPVPPDGETIGEIMFRGNITMNGYLKNPIGHRRSLRRRLAAYRRSGGDRAGRIRPHQRIVPRT